VTDVWAACGGQATPRPLDGVVFRLVESQEQVATNALVHTLAEQALLEDLLEASKPALPREATALHYLLATPFRYPPLPWGSRFATRFEPSLFYGSRRPDTVLAESAYYRCVFWSGMSQPPPRALETRHSLFSATVHTGRGLHLQEAPFDRFETVLMHRAEYADTQALGAAMRAAGIEAFEYKSARDPQHDLNVALFTPRAFASPRPTSLDEWLCETDSERVCFYSRHGGGIREFPVQAFLVDGALPQPPA
jgi:hypothetical protein